MSVQSGEMEPGQASLPALECHSWDRMWPRQEPASHTWGRTRSRLHEEHLRRVIYCIGAGSTVTVYRKIAKTYERPKAASGATSQRDKVSPTSLRLTAEKTRE